VRLVKLLVRESGSTLNLLDGGDGLPFTAGAKVFAAGAVPPDTAGFAGNGPAELF
jgi:hypothetical protein